MTRTRSDRQGRRFVLSSSLCLLFAVTPMADGQTSFFSADGYRISDFRAPVPGTVPGGTTVHTDTVISMLDNRQTAPLLIDVMPSPPKPKNLSPTALWLPTPRQHIPNSVWLPNVGHGRLSDELDDYFRRQLERLTQGDTSRPLVFYCQADCWMSWNATQRAAAYGYQNALWYPEGNDGWQAAGLPLETANPVPMP